MSMGPRPDLMAMTTIEVAAMTTVSESQLVRLRQRGEGPPASKFGDRFWYSRPAVEKWIADGGPARYSRAWKAIKARDKVAATVVAQIDRKAQVAMVRTLDVVFNPDTGRYADGWSDKRVAEEAGVDLATVTAYRDDAYGPLAVVEPDPLVAARTQIVALANDAIRSIGEARDEALAQIGLASIKPANGDGR